MFQQTFVPEGRDARRPLGTFLSLSLQLAVLAILSFVHLLYIPPIPMAQLRILLTPPLPLVNTAPRVQTHSPAGAALVHTVRPVLFSPPSIPKQIARIETAVDIPEAPSISIGSSVAVGTGIAADLLSGTNRIPGIAPAPVMKAPLVRGPVRVGGSVAAANLIEQVQPLYPPLARSARVQGTVEFSATIDKSGRVVNLHLLHGHPLLVAAAESAILKWRYRPTLLNGQPVEVLTTIVVNFTLSN